MFVMGRRGRGGVKMEGLGAPEEGGRGVYWWGGVEGKVLTVEEVVVVVKGTRDAAGEKIVGERIVGERIARERGDMGGSCAVLGALVSCSPCRAPVGLCEMSSGGVCDQTAEWSATTGDGGLVM